MKNIFLSFHDFIKKNLPVTLLLLLLPGCIKLPECEKWEVRDEKHNVGGCIDWSCTGDHTWQLSFCGDDLKDAKAGNIIILYNDNCCKKTRTFLRLIK